MKKADVAVAVVNWNGEEDSLHCISLLRKQTLAHTIIAVDNGSTDNFVEKAQKQKDIVLIRNPKNLGFTGGVNAAMNYAIEHGFKYIALINNDAQPEKDWLQELVSLLDKDNKAGIATGKLMKTDGLIDSTGDIYTSWGLAYPRGRDTKDTGQFDKEELVFAASGGASIYRVAMLEQIGVLDDDFFAYYEDVDLSFRAQLAGWKVKYTPRAVAHHKVGMTSKKIPNLTTYMTIRNLPWLFWKNVPLRLLLRIMPRFAFAYSSLVASSLSKGKFAPVLKGLCMSTILTPKKLLQRRAIQRSRAVSSDYISSAIVHDLPPNAYKLRKIRDSISLRK